MGECITVLNRGNPGRPIGLDDESENDDATMQKKRVSLRGSVVIHLEDRIQLC